MKKCTKCGIEKPLTAFRKRTASRDELAYRCKTCVQLNYKESQQTPKGKAARRESRRKYWETEESKESYREYRLTFPEKIKAGSAVSNAIRDGKMKRSVFCEKCGLPAKTEGHHWSYEEEHWLDVEWLCRSCHVELHRELLLV